MAFDFTTIKNNPEEELIRLASLIDPQINLLEDSLCKVHYCYPQRGYRPCDIIYYVNVIYPGGSYDSPTLRVVVRNEITVSPRVVAMKMKSEYNGNVLLVNRWGGEVSSEEVEVIFRKDKLKVVWWKKLL